MGLPHHTTPLLEAETELATADRQQRRISNSSNASSTVGSSLTSGTRSSFVGTAQYISPEVLKSAETVGPECDYWVWS